MSCSKLKVLMIVSILMVSLIAMGAVNVYAAEFNDFQLSNDGDVKATFEYDNGVKRLTIKGSGTIIYSKWVEMAQKINGDYFGSFPNTAWTAAEEDFSIVFEGATKAIKLNGTGGLNGENGLFRDFDGAIEFNGAVALSPNAINLANMFRGATQFNEKVDFDTSNIRDMHGMFAGATAFNQPVNFDTGKVENMSEMFSEATAFNRPVDFDTNRVTDMSAMFSGATAFNQPVDFDTSKVTSMKSMFSGATSFNQPVDFSTRSVKTMQAMFAGATSFNQPVNLNSKEVENMNTMFYNTPALDQAIELHIDATTTLYKMFTNSAVNSIKLNNWSGAHNIAAGQFIDENNHLQYLEFSGLESFTLNKLLDGDCIVKNLTNQTVELHGANDGSYTFNANNHYQIIKPGAIESCIISSVDIQVYTGNPIEPKLVIKDPQRDNAILEEGRDYTLSYRDNVAAGTAYITVTGINNYYSTTEEFFLIRKEIKLTADPIVKVYDGEAVRMSAITGRTATFEGASVAGNWEFVSDPNFYIYCQNNEVELRFRPTSSDYSTATIKTPITITEKPVTISGVTAKNRDYIPGEVSVNLITGNAQIEGLVDADRRLVRLTRDAKGVMVDPNAGLNKPVTPNLTLSGQAAANYKIVDLPTVTVDIAKLDPIAPSQISALKGQTLAEASIGQPGTTEGSWAFAQPAELVGEVGENRHQMIFTPDARANYNSATADVGVHVSKASLSLASITRQHVKGAKNAVTIDLAALLPAGADYQSAVITGIEGKNSILSSAAAPAVAETQLKYTLSGVGQVGDKVELTLLISSKNYQDVVQKVVVELVEKDIPQLNLNALTLAHNKAKTGKMYFDIRDILPDDALLRSIAVESVVDRAGVLKKVDGVAVKVQSNSSIISYTLSGEANANDYATVKLKVRTDNYQEASFELNIKLNDSNDNGQNNDNQNGQNDDNQNGQNNDSQNGQNNDNQNSQNNDNQNGQNNNGNSENNQFLIDQFSDVSIIDWFSGAVNYVVNKGLMKGTSETTFSPQMMTTRAMLVTLLYRLEGEPDVDDIAVFSDVSSDAWYGKAVTWGTAQKIVKGYEGGLFKPDVALTREQLATMLYRYAQLKQYDTLGGADLTVYSDAVTISSYARTAMVWAVSQDIIGGVSPTQLKPQGIATRAQLATIMMRLLEKND